MTPSDAVAKSGVPARRYASVAAFETALKTKLVARLTTGRTIQDIRKQLAFDRVLARLTHVAPEAWLLKGGVALEYRLERARATVDIDISAQVSLDTMISILKAAASLELNDYFRIEVGERSKPVDEVETYRFAVTVLYENARIFEKLTIDVGFADPTLGEPQELRAPSLLDFAGIPPGTVRAIPIEQHLAEKIHAYTRRYGDRESTRVKDLVDMALILSESPALDGAVAQAIHDVFAARGTHDVPHTLPLPPSSWRVAYAALASNLPIPQTTDEAHRFVAETLAASLHAAALCGVDQ